MKKTFNLSEKTEWSYDGDGTETSYYKEEDVKEFIKQLKGLSRKIRGDLGNWVHVDIIDELAGEKLNDK